MSARARYVSVGGERVFSMLHSPPGGPSCDVAVLLCPPFGWDDVTSYRARRDWAEHLAGQGHTTLRYHLPGEGDSAGGPEDAGRLDAWVEATSAVARRLAADTGCRRLVAVGVGLGGMLAVAAGAAGAPIDDFVLWGVPARGHTLLRELEVFARMETARIVEAGAPEPPPLAEGVIAPGGFLLTGETTAALRGLDLTSATFDGDGRRVLLLGRDGMAPDDRLAVHLRESGAAVSVDEGAGYGSMLDQPEVSRPPVKTFAVVDAWLAASPPTQSAAPAAQAADAPQTTDAVEFEADGRRVRERPLWLDVEGTRLFAVLAEPAEREAESLTAVLLNAGALPHIGPNRMVVEIARRWAARGVPTVRLDVEGLGDSDGESGRYAELAAFHAPERVEQVCGALDVLAATGLAPRFVVGGLCAGAYWAFHCALQDERVGAAIMLNPRALYWDEGLEVRREARRLRLLSSGTVWRRLLRGEVTVARLRRFVAGAMRSGLTAPRGEDPVPAAFDRLRELDRRAVFIFCDGEPLRQELEDVGHLPPGDRWPNIELAFFAGRDHTARPRWMRPQLHAALDRALEVELQRLD